MKTTKVKETYRVEDDGGRFVVVEKFPDRRDGKINVLNESFLAKDGEFIFKGSKPNIVKAIGELLIEASRL